MLIIYFQQFSKNLYLVSKLLNECLNHGGPITRSGISGGGGPSVDAHTHGEISHDIPEAAHHPRHHVPLQCDLRQLAAGPLTVVSRTVLTLLTRDTGDHSRRELSQAELRVRGSWSRDGDGVSAAGYNVTHDYDDGAVKAQEKLMIKHKDAGVFVVTRSVTSALGSHTSPAHISAPYLHKVDEMEPIGVNISETNWVKSEAMIYRLNVYFYIFQLCIESAVDCIVLLSFTAHRPSLTEPNFHPQPHGN